MVIFSCELKRSLSSNYMLESAFVCLNIVLVIVIGKFKENLLFVLD